MVYVPVDLSGSAAYFDVCAWECNPGEREGKESVESECERFEDHCVRVEHCGGESWYGVEMKVVAGE